MVTKTYTLYASASLHPDPPNSEGLYHYTTGGVFNGSYTVDTGPDDTFNYGDTYTLVQAGAAPPITATFVGYAQEGKVLQPIFQFSNGVTRILSDVSLYPRLSEIYARHDDLVLCFLAGTMIATPYGEVAIETLLPGDLVLTHDGRMAPVKWLFEQTLSTQFSDPLRVTPIRIRAGALGIGAPSRDLLVSPDHALLLHGVLVQAGALVDGVDIAPAQGMPEVFTYYHVELHGHDLVLAEGVPAETFIDNVSRRTFDNWRAYEAVYGQDPVPMAELTQPRVKSARQLPDELRLNVAA